MADYDRPEMADSKASMGQGSAVARDNILGYMEQQSNMLSILLKEVTELENGIHPILINPDTDGGEKDPGERARMSELAAHIIHNNEQIRNATSYIRSIRARVNL